ncbi:MAG: MFS transporter [Myxococcaceae bacterium]|jgi:MFS family permease|nr:MFS transporter [Myxococcaceae bacterium]MCA3012155.1 MFS transporter [Myxococcaceae bacterium]
MATVDLPLGPEPTTAAAPARKKMLPVLFLGVFMAALDAAVVAPAVPALKAAFGVDHRQVGLVTIVFSLCSLSASALMANLSDRLGRRTVYLADVAGFALGSLVIAQADGFGAVLVGRALQGLCAGGITPTASAVVGDAFPPQERGRVLGLIGATFGMAFLVGPMLASVVLVVASWRWIFLVNLPVAALVFGLGLSALPGRTGPQPRAPFDAAGVAVLAVTLGSLMLGINRALDVHLGRTLWPALLVAAAVGVVSLAFLERQAAQPVMPLPLFQRVPLLRAWLLCLGAGFGMGSIIFVSSLAVSAFGVTAERAGLLLIPLVLASAAGSMGFGRLQHRLGARAVLGTGFGALVLGAGLLGAVTESWASFFVATTLLGLGVGVVVGGTLRTMVLDEVGAAERGAAQALVNIFISIGNLLVVATLGAVAEGAGGGTPGLSRAYLVVAFVMLVMAGVAATIGPPRSRAATA